MILTKPSNSDANRTGNTSYKGKSSQDIKKMHMVASLGGRTKTDDIREKIGAMMEAAGQETSCHL